MPKITSEDLKAFADKTVNLSSEEATAGRERVRVLRERLEAKVKAEPGFALVKMLHAGSVEKRTALSKVNDMDVAVYVRKDEAPTNESDLIHWIAERVRECYGATIASNAVSEGVHCATISFASGLAVDVVPVLYEGDADDRGYLVAKDSGDRLLTSVTLHLKFIRERKKKHPGDYAQVVRYVKWWVREQRNTQGESFKFKSFMAELVVAYLADNGMSLTDHGAALAGFFQFIVDTKFGERVWFSDYYAATDLPPPTGDVIEVFDPVNPNNNVAFRYGPKERDLIVSAAEAALDALVESKYTTTKAEAVACWQVVLGTRFKG
jgi:tRNA nucleotidyltransferase (CCA-adding enzyme)